MTTEPTLEDIRAATSLLQKNRADVFTDEDGEEYYAWDPETDFIANQKTGTWVLGGVDEDTYRELLELPDE